MIELLTAIVITGCLMSGVCLRYIPFRSVVSDKQKRILKIAYFSSAVIYGVAIFRLLNEGFLFIAVFRYSGLIFAVVTALINIFVIPGRMKEHMFVFGVVTTCDQLVLSLPSFIVPKFLVPESINSFLIWALAYGVLLLLTFYPMKMLLNHTVEPFLHIDIGMYRSTIWFIPIGIFISTLLMVPGNSYITTVAELFSRIVTVVVMILICFSITMDYERIREKRLLEEQLEMSGIHYAGLRSKMEEARKMRHDLKHLVASVRYYIDTDDKTALNDFCNEIETHPVLFINIPYTGNSAVDGLLYHYIQKSQELNIHMRYTGIAKSRGIKDTDLCVLLGNALDNAIEGCLTFQGERNITVVAQTDAETLSFVVQNTFDGKVEMNGDVLLSRKRENQSGLGIRSMRSICEKYSGTMNTKWDEHTFTVLFVLTFG